MRNKQIKKLVLNLTEGLLSTTTDLLLVQIYLLGASLGKGKTSHGAYQIIQEVSDSLEDLNYKTLKESFSYLKRKGLIRSLKEPKITQMGVKKLQETIPIYQQNRPWDESIYLVTYDIQETNRHYRNQLRAVLKRLGSALLQASVWITPYNPEKILRDFSSKPSFKGEIIISCIGKDGYIGEEKIEKLISRVFSLNDLNLRYKQFIKHYKNSDDKWNAAVLYLSILKDDPQLPFELLPDDWLGDKAIKLFRKLTTTN